MLFSIFEVTTVWEFDYFGWHSRARWFVDANEYKSKVMREPLERDGSLRHVEWEGWGWPGVGDTVTYLVFDPNDWLKDASTTGQSGQYQGITCSDTGRIVRSVSGHHLFCASRAPIGKELVHGPLSHRPRLDSLPVAGCMTDSPSE